MDEAGRQLRRHCCVLARNNGGPLWGGDSRIERETERQRQTEGQDRLTDLHLK